MVARAWWQLRCRDRQRSLAIHDLCGMASVLRIAHAVLCFSAWDARPMVQEDISDQTSQKMALLAVGGLPCSARCRRGHLYFGGGTSPGARIFLALSLSRR